MELSQIIPHIEALVFASDKPLTRMELTDLVNNALGFIEDRANLEQIDAALDGIKEKYSSEFYAFELREIGGGLQFLTKKEYYKTVALLNGEKFLKRLSTAALETLAIIAYKQPITKSEMEAIRGVNCDYAVQKLLEKDLVVISGRKEDAVGQPLIYSTSKSFMDYFGINSADDLPKISEVMMEELVNATNVQEAQAEQFEHEHPNLENHIEENPENENIVAAATEAPTNGHEILKEETVEEHEVVELQDETLENESINEDNQDNKENPAEH